MAVLTTRQIDDELKSYRQQLVRAQMRAVVSYDTCHPVVSMFGDTCCAWNPYCGVCGQNRESHTPHGSGLLCPIDDKEQPNE